MQPACREQLAWEKPAYSRQNYRAPPPRQSAGLPKRHQTHASIQTISQRANRPSGPSPGTQRGKASRSVPTVPTAPAQARSEAKPRAACQRPSGPSPGTQRGKASRSVPNALPRLDASPRRQAANSAADARHRPPGRRPAGRRPGKPGGARDGPPGAKPAPSRCRPRGHGRMPQAGRLPGRRRRATPPRRPSACSGWEC